MHSDDDPRDGRKNDACEICGVKWKGAFNVPRARALPSPEESMRRVQLLLSAAYIRIVMDIPRTNDHHILATLGPHVSGPWLEYLRREARVVHVSLVYSLRLDWQAFHSGGNTWFMRFQRQTLVGAE